MKNFLCEQLERTNYWLSFSEAKNGALVAVNIAIIAVCVQIRDTLFVMHSVICILLLVSMVICLISFFPNLNNKIDNCKNESTNDINLIFYGDIAKLKDANIYIKCLKENYDLEFVGCEKKLYDDLATEIIINSKITVWKFSLFKKAVFTDVIAISVLVIGFIVA